ncbi:MAG: flagellar hook-basal body complex protein [Candidatus Cloacimonetes bacterium]|nr:flagellar hook-basal body complex protein [Candidatus Cloacimonadota bacterium]
MSFLEHMRLGTTGLRGYQQKLDVIGNNISNSGTTGFKKSGVSFAESWNHVTSNSIETQGASSVLGPTSKGYGIGKAIIDLDSSQGQYQETGNPLDLAIQGDGFFVVEDLGRQFYSRDGNLRVNKNQVLVQESTGSFIKGWVANLSADGTSTVDTAGESSKMSFEFIQNIEARPTTEMSFRSNLNSATIGRKVELDQSTYSIRDEFNNTANVTAKWTQKDENTWEFSVVQDEETKFTSEVDINRFGDVGKFTLQSEDQLEITRDTNDKITHISWNYNTQDFDLKPVEKTMTIEFPSNVVYKDNTSNFSHTVRNAHPSDPDYLSSGSGTYQAVYTQGDRHVASSEVVDSAGYPHTISTIFEFVDPKNNQWEYKVKLPENDPLVTAYLKDPINNVVNPELPTDREIEAANDFIFGTSRTGLFNFNTGGFIDQSTASIPKLLSSKPQPKAVILGTANIESVDKTFISELSTKFQPQGADYKYTLLLDTNHPDIQSLANDPLNGIVDPSNISEDEQIVLNDIIFKGSNTGTIVYDELGAVDLVKSTIPRVVATLSQGQLDSPLPDSLFNGAVDKLPTDELKDVGTLNINMNTNLISGFGSPFSTQVDAQDGYVAGTLKDASITSNGDGTIVGTFSNNQERILGQMALAVFPNAGGLNSVGGNRFSLGDNSGFDEGSIGKPNSSTHGLIISNYLELSNVDLAEEFTQLIIAQRSYSLGSKIVTTADQLLQTGIGVKR